MVVTKNISLTGETFIALPATEMLSMPVLVHRLGIFATENELKRKDYYREKFVKIENTGIT